MPPLRRGLEGLNALLCAPLPHAAALPGEHADAKFPHIALIGSGLGVGQGGDEEQIPVDLLAPLAKYDAYEPGSY